MYGNHMATLPATGAGVGMTGALSTGSLLLGLVTLVLMAIALYQLLRPSNHPRP